MNISHFTKGNSSKIFKFPYHTIVLVFFFKKKEEAPSLVFLTVNLYCSFSCLADTNESNQGQMCCFFPSSRQKNR